MRVPRNPPSFELFVPEGKANKRRHGRLKCEMLSCYLGDVLLGDVLDISASGMRIEGRGRLMVHLKQYVQIKLESPMGHLLVKAHVVWIRKTGLFRHQVGLEFVDIDSHTSAALTSLATVSAKSSNLT